MSTIKTIFAGICVSLLTLTLFGFGTAWAIHKVIGGPEDIKQALRDSGLYQSGISDALAQAQKGDSGAASGSGTDQQIPLNNSDVRNIISTAFPASFVQSQAEGALDSVFGYLGGKTNSLQFTINLSDSKTRLADGLDSYVQQHLASLPACTAVDLQQQAAAGNFDPYSAACLPPGTNVAEAANAARNQILQGDFLKDTQLDASNLKTSNGKTLDQQLQPAKGVYQCVRSCYIYTGIAAVVLAAGVILLSMTWRSGIRKVAIVSLSVGAGEALLGWVGTLLVHRGLQEVMKTSTANQPLQQKSIHIAESLITTLLQTWLWYGVVLIVLGVGALVVLHFTKPKITAEKLAGALEPIENPGEGRPKHKGLKPNLPETKS